MAIKDLEGALAEKLEPSIEKKKESKTTNLPTSTVSKLPIVHNTTEPRHRDTMVPRHHGTIEAVRKAVKSFGKEAATHRFTLEEKKIMADIIYSYKAQGIKTSENEITRIAINYINEDYKKNGETSILDKVIKALNR